MEQHGWQPGEVGKKGQGVGVEQEEEEGGDIKFFFFCKCFI